MPVIFGFRMVPRHVLRAKQSAMGFAGVAVVVGTFVAWHATGGWDNFPDDFPGKPASRKKAPAALVATAAPASTSTLQQASVLPDVPVAEPLVFQNPADERRFQGAGLALANAAAWQSKVVVADDLAGISSGIKGSAAACAQLARDDAFLVALGHPDADKLRTDGRASCQRDGPLGVVRACAKAIPRRPAEKKSLCLVGQEAAAMLQAEHYGDDSSVADGLQALAKACEK